MGARLFNPCGRLTGFAGRMGYAKGGLKDVTMSAPYPLLPNSSIGSAALKSICLAGNDTVNVLAMAGGILCVFFLGKVHLPGIIDFGSFMPAWWPQIAWPWYVLIGCSATLVIALPFKTRGTGGQGFLP